MANLGELSGQITIDGKGADKVLDLINKKLGEVVSESHKAGQATDSFGIRLGRVGEIAGGIISANIFSRVASGITDIAMAIPNAAFAGLDLAKNLQAVSASLGVLLGDKDKAKNLLKDLAEFAKVTPFSLVDLQKYTKQLIAAGFQSDEMINTLEALGDIASSVGMDNMPFLIKALGDVRLAGKFAGTELIQFRNAGINVAAVFKEKFGKSVEEVNEAIEEGTITYQQAEDAILSLGRAGGKFDGIMSELSTNTLVGLESNLSDLKDQFLATVGGFDIATGEVVEGGFLDKVQDGVRELIEYLSSPEGSETLSSLGKSLSELFGNVGEFAIKIVKEYLPRVLAFIKDELVPGFLQFTKWLTDSTPKIIQFINDVIVAGRSTVQLFSDILGIMKSIFEVMKGIVALLNFNSPNAWRDRMSADLQQMSEGAALQNQWKQNTSNQWHAPLAPRFAEGTNWFRGGTALVGEKGPELVNLPRGSSVIPNHRMGGSGAGIVNYNTFNNGLDIDTFNDKMNLQFKIS